MYVADVTDPEELRYLESEALNWLRDQPNSEQAKWDLEDIRGRMRELGL